MKIEMIELRFPFGVKCKVHCSQRIKKDTIEQQVLPYRFVNTSLPTIDEIKSNFY
jgi:hypothetical protein